MVHKMKTRTITRTITTNVCTVLEFVKTTKQINTEEVHFIGNYTDKELEKLCKEYINDDTFQFVAITDVAKFDKLYEMNESDFVAMARVIDK